MLAHGLTGLVHTLVAHIQMKKVTEMADLPPSMQSPQLRGKAMAKLPPVKRRSMPILLAITAIRKGTLSPIAEREKRMRWTEKRRIKRAEAAPGP